MLPNFEPQVFSMHFDRFPLWLFALENMFCQKLIILGFTSSSMFKLQCETQGLSMTLIHRAIVHLGLGRISHQTSLVPLQASTLLLSGSRRFLELSVRKLPASCHVLSVCTVHWSSRVVPRDLGTALRLRHRNFGGSTHYAALVAFQNLPCRPQETTLRRTLAHVFDYGIKPRPVQEEELQELLDRSLLIDGIIHPTDMMRNVLHRTTYFRSGWGIRSLTVDELGLAFGFPGWLQAGGLSIDDFLCAPVQILDACLRAVLITRPGIPPSSDPQTVVQPPLPSMTWFPALHRSLPHAWIDSSLVTSKAVKLDDALVETALWDKRVTLIHSWSPALGRRLLAFYRGRLMRQYRHRLLREFGIYMRTQHGATWPYRLDCYRVIETKKAALKAAEKAAEEDAAKAEAEAVLQVASEGRKRQRGVRTNSKQSRRKS
jgi:hypothetical protein